MWGIVSMLTEGGQQQFCADDLADRLSRRYSVLILVAFAIVITMHTYVGNPVTCWAPAQFTDNHVRYANSLCWVRNTYYLPNTSPIPFLGTTTLAPSDDTTARMETGKERPRELLYYQWLPFIFLLQAIMFHLPNTVWRGLNSKAGIDTDHILEAARAIRKTGTFANQQRIIDLVANQIRRLVVNRSTAGKRCAVSLRNLVELACSCCCGKRFGNYIFLVFMIVKALYILNAFSQLFILGSVLNTNYSRFGWEMLAAAWNEQTIWAREDFGNVSTIFPRVTLCDVYVRRLGTLQRFTLQCVLPMNLYAETMFAFFWVWLLFVVLFSLYGVIQWLSRIFPIAQRRHYTYVLLKAEKCINTDSNQDYMMCEKFVAEYLKIDGVLLLMLIEENTGSVTSAEVAAAIWHGWPELSRHVTKTNSRERRKPRRIAPSAPPKSDPPASTVHRPEKPATVPSPPEKVSKIPPTIPPRPRTAPPPPPKLRPPPTPP